MALFNRTFRIGGIMDAIRCDEPSYLIWKWHPKGTVTGESKRETAIRWGSSLRVKEGEVASDNGSKTIGQTETVYYLLGKRSRF